mgnify:CR=1 FL=1
MNTQQFSSVWDAIEAQDAKNLRLRSRLMMALTEHITAVGWTQNDAAVRLGVTQPRISDLVRGKINLFSLDALVNMATAAGLRVDITIDHAA